MKEKTVKGIRKEIRVKRFQNDYDYPWDERYTVDFGGIDTIKRCMDFDGIITSGRTGKKY